jgi:L-threonylcarbamoyladenylate synthase
MSGPRAPIVQPTDEAIARAAEALADGRLVAFPTETVYGLGGNADDPAAVRAIFAAKGRPADHPVIVHVHDAAMLDEWASSVPASARALAGALWPGPLTLIVPKAASVDPLVTGGQESVGIRVPSHPVAQRLLRAFHERGGRGVAAPSANRFGHVSPTCADHVADDLGDRVALILDGGACDIGLESTIVACLDDEPMVLRPGGVPLEALTRVLGRPPRASHADAPRASGTLATHYATRTQAMLVAPAALRAELAQLDERDERVAVLARTIARPIGFTGAWIGAAVEPARYAHELYASLRALDRADADVIVIEAVPDAPDWSAVRDRLMRATHADDDRT